MTCSRSIRFFLLFLGSLVLSLGLTILGVMVAVAAFSDVDVPLWKIASRILFCIVVLVFAVHLSIRTVKNWRSFRAS